MFGTNTTHAPLGLACALSVLAVVGCESRPRQPAWTPPGGDGSTESAVDARVEDLLARLTLDEKLAMLSGGPSGFDTLGVGRAEVAVPPLAMTDGPLGVRWGASTAFPAGVAMAASFDRALVRRAGEAIAREAKAKGRNVVLAPCVNIVRVPHGGRSFESFGEDPYLAARMTVAYVEGVQSEGVVATVKHYAANNQETDRMTVDALVDERTLHEIYFPAFRAAVEEAQVQAVMCSYNKLNGPWACESPSLLTDVLKGSWGFRGLVMSDWGATHSVARALNAGLDLEMPGGQFLTPENVRRALEAGETTQAVVDEAVRRQLRVITRMGLLDGPPGGGEVDTAAHRTLNRELARAGIVLLKNEEGLLPLARAQVGTVAVIGPMADAYAVGGGSSRVEPTSVVTPLAALREALGTVPSIVHDAGFDPAAAAAVAAGADVALVFVGTGELEESEGFDRPSLELSGTQSQLISSVAAANPRTIVVVATGAPVLMGGWLGQVPAVLQVWFGGQEQGHAIADVLLGEASPSGKLPVTFPRRWEDCPAYGNFPGTGGAVTYAEGLMVGYRHFDTRALAPEFPFGHGLSYTTFAYRDLTVEPATPERSITVRVKIANTGTRAGAEVAQLYIHDIDATVTRPEQELKAFEKVTLSAGQETEVTFTLDEQAFATYDATVHAWRVKPGRFELRIGSSSRDIRVATTVTL